MKRIIELVLIFLVLPIIGLAQQHSVQLSGYVYDADTKEALIGVTIQNLGDKSGHLLTTMVITPLPSLLMRRLGFASHTLALSP